MEYPEARTETKETTFITSNYDINENHLKTNM